MSFLNPVSEPVLMFSSTDTGAPKINYASRAAGDVKTVLKACLVTGYGTKQSAGWAMLNETEFAAEFSSPSIYMADYLLSVDDNSPNETFFNYKFQSQLIFPAYSKLDKWIDYVNRSSAKNTWTLLVTAQGFLWIEKFLHESLDIETCRVLYFGRVKSALVDDGGKNISFYNFGCNGGVPQVSAFFYQEPQHVVLNSYSNTQKNSPILSLLKKESINRSVMAVEPSSSIYLSSDTLLAEMMPIIMTKQNDASKLFGLRQVMFNNRPALYFCIGTSYNYPSQDSLINVCDGCYVYLDNWSY